MPGPGGAAARSRGQASLTRLLRSMEASSGLAAAAARGSQNVGLEDLMRLDIPSLIVPGADDFHATSAARYLQECLPASEYWDVPVESQTAENAPQRVLDFLDRIPA